MTVIILAGGRSRRMGGRDKAFIKIGKDTIIARQVGSLKKYFKKIIVVTNAKDRYKGLKGIEVISDIIPDQGPLGGILSGLLASEDRYNFVVACDMPFIDPRLIKYMYGKSNGYDVVVPRVNGMYEPLFSVYSKDCIRHIMPLVNKKIFKVSRLFSRVKVKRIGKAELSRFGRAKKIFMNLNTPEDMLRLYE